MNVELRLTSDVKQGMRQVRKTVCASRSDPGRRLASQRHPPSTRLLFFSCRHRSASAERRQKDREIPRERMIQHDRSRGVHQKTTNAPGAHPTPRIGQRRPHAIDPAPTAPMAKPSRGTFTCACDRRHPFQLHIRPLLRWTAGPGAVAETPKFKIASPTTAGSIGNGFGFVDTSLVA